MPTKPNCAYDFEDTTIIHCPHCKAEVSDAWEVLPYNDEEANEIDCHRCDRAFHVRARVHHTWDIATTEERLSDGDYGPESN